MSLLDGISHFLIKDDVALRKRVKVSVRLISLGEERPSYRWSEQARHSTLKPAQHLNG